MNEGISDLQWKVNLARRQRDNLWTSKILHSEIVRKLAKCGVK